MALHDFKQMGSIFLSSVHHLVFLASFSCPHPIWRPLLPQPGTMGRARALPSVLRGGSTVCLGRKLVCSPPPLVLDVAVEEAKSAELRATRPFPPSPGQQVSTQGAAGGGRGNGVPPVEAKAVSSSCPSLPPFRGDCSAQRDPDSQRLMRVRVSRGDALWLPVN